jgi:arylsulfatase A
MSEMKTKMKIKQTTTGTTALTFAIFIPAPLTAFHSTIIPKQDIKPNIVFILADDYGLDGVGCYNSDRFRGKTPNLDRLAETGIRFTQCYSMPVSGPSRCSIMTGRYGFRTGGLTNQSAIQPSFKNEPSIARTLKQSGYATGMAGKWRQMGDTPGEWGFDEWLTDHAAAGWYWKTNYTKNGQFVETDQPVYCPDVCLNFAADFFERHREHPFYFYYPTHLVHGPIVNTPDSRSNTNDLYEDNVAYLDKQIGQLLDELKKLGLLEKTLIVFSGDNGTASFGADQSYLNGRKINGKKGTMLEGGSRVPLIANWKGTIPAGKVLNDLVDFSDFFATFIEIADANMPKGIAFDSHSFAPQLFGEKGNPRRWIFVQLGDQWYIRDKDFKLTQKGELFDMSEAPFIEKPIFINLNDKSAIEAKDRLQTVLDKLNPSGGIRENVLENGKQKKKEKNKESKPSKNNKPKKQKNKIFTTKSPYPVM